MRGRRGQSTVEYLLMVSVITIALAWVAGDVFKPSFQKGLNAMQTDVADMTKDGIVEK